MMTLNDSTAAYDWNGAAASGAADTAKWRARMAISGAVVSSAYPTFIGELENNSIAATKVFYSTPAALPTVATIEAVAATTGSVIDKWPSASTATAAGMPTAKGGWIYDKAASPVVAGSATLDVIAELTIKKEFNTKALVDAFAMKEKMTTACGLIDNLTSGSEDKKGAIKTADWTFATAAGSAAYMAGASVVAAAALLF